VTRVFTVVAATLAGATLVGLVLLWPGHVESPLAQGAVVDSDKAEVERVNEVICAGFAEQKCQDATVRLKSGPEAGKKVHIQLGATGALDPDLDPGDDIRVIEAPKPRPGTPARGWHGLQPSTISSAAARCSCWRRCS
jgi:hypothetical protein